MIHKLEKAIEHYSCEVFNISKSEYLESKEFMPEKIDAMTFTSYSIAVLKLLIWIKANLFKDGKLSMPIWKWPSVIKAIRDFITSLAVLALFIFNINNPENWIQISRTNKNEKYYSDWCGKELNRWTWAVSTSHGINKMQTIDPSNCSGYYTLLQYSLIF